MTHMPVTLDEFAHAKVYAKIVFKVDILLSILNDIIDYIYYLEVKKWE